MQTKDQLIDGIVELYKSSEEKAENKNLSQQERFVAAVLCNAYAAAIARIHLTFFPIIKDDKDTIILHSNISISTMDTVNLSVSSLKEIYTSASSQALDTDIVHLVNDNDLLTAYILEPHLKSRKRQIHCTRSIFNIEQ